MKNLIIRAFTGLIFVVVIISGIWYSAYTFLVLFGIITGLTVWELYGLLYGKGTNLIKRSTQVLGGVYLFASTFMYNYGIANEDIFLPYLLFVLSIFIMELYYKAENPISNWANLLFIQIYAAGSFSLLNLVAIEGGNYSVIPLFAIFVFVWINDTGAYLVGSTIGKRRLFERISPKKSWEGFLGGITFVLLVAYWASCYFVEISWYNWLGLASTIVVFATWGDLTESLLKRTLKVKDSGNILPGHGGILDRFDSIIMAVPAAYIYLELFIRN
ncbi:phosphatidate cytidylyltransferase [Massilibacteroides sp.]|uniref:phosphatidate cytidylyltransferase n=1 Tax=Massilibacteroides sp. TaxID=2034766 RepID=UPI0026019364|nr:phosphatidate cytidylyltransferase [Massilibacteroides sp.]MDD4514316.1 phosphatidate cytidylyltransferase [Massilibacteroides sp.]